MTQVTHLTTVFVEDIPERLEDGVLYVSRECHVAIHKCACGCSEEVATPLVPTEYDFIMEDGEASIWPSIGNHDFSCGSHYIIKRGRIHWADKMSRAQIEAGRAYDRLLKRGAPPRGIRVIVIWLKRLWTRFIG